MTDDAPPPHDPSHSTPSFGQALLFETGVLVLALALGWVLAVDPFRHADIGWWSLAAGVLATVPLLGALGLLQRSSDPAVLELRRLVEEVLGPLVRGAPLWAIVALSLMAGVAEEALFRGVFQGWLTSVAGWPTALVVASVAFGVVHWVTRLYAVLAGLVGLYLGALYLWSGNLVVPIVAHAVYDIVALQYLRGAARKEQPEAP